jgi:hypothetical protein
MDHENGNSQLLEILKQSAMIMAGDFQQRLDLGKRHEHPDAVDEGARIPRVSSQRPERDNVQSADDAGARWKK